MDPHLFSGLSADTAMRFRVVAEMLQRYSSEFPKSPRLLDVGGYPGLFVRTFTDLFPRWSGMTVDTPEENLRDYTSGSGTDLPFENEAYDAVVSIDTFEHIPPTERQDFISELCRVSKGIVVLAAPFHHPATAAIERALDESHRRLFHEAHPWLKEHVDYGLPALELVPKYIPDEFSIVDAAATVDLESWTTWQTLSLAQKLRGELDGTWEAYDGAAAARPDLGVRTVPYRLALVLARHGRIDKKIDDLLPPPDHGHHIVEQARLQLRILELLARRPEEDMTLDTPILMIDQRLKEALAAAEQEIARLEQRLAEGTGGDRSGRGGIFRLFGR